MTKETRMLTEESGEGPPIRIPVATINGHKDGPTILMVAGVHGSEYVGQEATRRLFQTIQPEDLAGRLICVPCFGLPAFYGFETHVSPVDGENPARLFPGDPSGSHTQRYDYLLWSKLVEEADAVVDIHGGDLEEDLTEYVQVDLTRSEAVNQASIELAHGFGFDLAVHQPAANEKPETGNLFSQAAWHGKPGCLTEAGSHGLLDDELVSWYRDRLVQGLRSFGMLDHGNEVNEPRILYRFGGLFADTDGCWYPSVEKGETIHQGQVIGELRDLFGAHVTDVVSDQDAVVLGVMTIPARPKGSMLLGYATIQP